MALSRSPIDVAYEKRIQFSDPKFSPETLTIASLSNNDKEKFEGLSNEYLSISPWIFGKT